MASALEAAAKVDSTMKATTAALKTATKAALDDSAKVAKSELESGPARGVTGGDLTFSGMSRYNHGGRLSVRTRQREGELTVSPKGPWMLAETGAQPHRINHPGTRGTQGRRSWTTGQEATFARLESDVPPQIERDVEGAFNG